VNLDTVLSENGKNGIPEKMASISSMNCQPSTKGRVQERSSATNLLWKSMVAWASVLDGWRGVAYSRGRGLGKVRGQQGRGKVMGKNKTTTRKIIKIHQYEVNSLKENEVSSCRKQRDIWGAQAVKVGNNVGLARLI